MNQWSFVAAAYALTLAAVGGLVIWSWLAMRIAETRLRDAADR